MEERLVEERLVGERPVGEQSPGQPLGQRRQEMLGVGRLLDVGR